MTPEQFIRDASLREVLMMSTVITAIIERNRNCDDHLMRDIMFEIGQKAKELEKKG